MKRKLFVILGFVALTAIVITACHRNIKTASDEKKEFTVPMITLNNHIKMPQIGFGTWELTGATATEAVKEAIKHGYRLIDTAQGYGNESDVGRGIRESSVSREDIFITTKINTNVMREGTVRESLDKSLEDLGVDYIDLVLIHWPVEGKVQETWQIMEEYVRIGKIKSIGLSNFNPHHIDELLAYATVKPVINQIEMHPYMTQYDVAEFTKSKNIQPEAWGPLGQGRNHVIEDETIVQIAQKHQKSPAQIILRWHIQRGNVVIPRSKTPNHIYENIHIFDFELSAEEMKTIDSLNRNTRVNSKNDPDSFPW